MKRRLFRNAALATLVGGAATMACSLGLDASKLKNGPVDLPDATVDGGAEASVELPPGVVPCTEDNKCPAQGCYKPRCVNGGCQYELCPTAQSCTHAACAAESCLEPTPHKFAAARMMLGNTGLGCEGRLGDCVSVVYPFAFVAHQTSDAPVAYPLVDFNMPVVDGGTVEATPAPIKLQNVDFTITRTVASGRRVWFIGQISISAKTTVPIAWIDVPVNPAAKVLEAKRAQIELRDQNAAFAEILPGADEGLIVLLKQQGGEQQRRATQLKVDGGTLPTDTTFTAINGWDGGAPIVTSSGDRLVLARSVSAPPPAVYYVDIVVRAGAPNNPVALGEQDLALTMGPLYPGASFGSTPIGAVVAQAAYAAVDVDAGTATLSGLRVGWIIQRADDPNRAANPYVDVVRYDPDGGIPDASPSSLVGPVAAVGDDQVLALQAEGAGTTVRAVKRSGTTALLDPGSFTTLPLAPGSYVVHGAVSQYNNKAYGYAFRAPASGSDGIHVEVFELGCGG